MATFIDNLSESEQVLELAKYVNKLKTKDQEGNTVFYDESVKLNEANQHLDLLKKLVNELPFLLSEGAEKEIEGFLFVVFSLAKKLPAEQKAVQQLVSEVTKHVTAKEDKPLLAIKLLNDLYNILGASSTDRYNVYLQLLRVAISSHSGGHITNQISEGDIDAKLAEWNLAQAQKKDVLKQIKDIFAAAESSKSFKWNVKYLNSFDVSNVSETDRYEAEKVVIEAIKNAEQFQFDDLLAVPVIKKLEGDPRHGKTFTLLKIFVSETQDAYKKFVEENPDFLGSHGLNGENTLKKIRLLSLASLASGNQEISYETIAKTLHVPETDVESWVISAISEEVIVGKLDQLRKVVYVSRSIQRVFTRTQWTQISDALKVWKSNIGTIMNYLQEAKKLTPEQQYAALNRTLQQN